MVLWLAYERATCYISNTQIPTAVKTWAHVHMTLLTRKHWHQATGYPAHCHL